MFKIFIVFMLLVFTGCGAKVTQPNTTLYSFMEQNYPCFKVDFPEQIVYDSYFKSESDERILLTYDVRMPGYDVIISKLYSKLNRLNYQALTSVYEQSSIIYNIEDEDFLADKLGLVVISSDDDSLILKGIVINYLQENIAVRIEIVRPIKMQGVFRTNNIEQWKNSTTGEKTIDNMVNILKYIYDNIDTQECSINSNLNINLVE